MQSTYFFLAQLKAKFDLENDSLIVGDIIRRTHEKYKVMRKQLFLQYAYIPEKHEALFSPHSISRDNGCGCRYCETLHAYARAKKHLHYLKRSFDCDFGIDTLMLHGEYTFPIESNFYALYSSETSEVSQLEFFEKESSRRKKEIKKLREAYRNSKEAILTILSSYST